MYQPDHSENDDSKDVEPIREKVFRLAPYMLVNRYLAMDLNKMPEMHRAFSHLGPLIKKLTLRDLTTRTHKFNARLGKEAGRLIVEYCENGTIQNKDLTMDFGRYDNGRGKLFELAKYLKNLKTLDCHKVRDGWKGFSVQTITKYCPKLVRLIVVADYINCWNFDIDLIIPRHATLKIIKINIQLRGGIETKILKLGQTMKERTPNLSSIEIDIEIDAYLKNWNCEPGILNRFNENNDMYCHFKEMSDLNRCIFSYSYFYEDIITLEVKLK